MTKGGTSAKAEGGGRGLCDWRVYVLRAHAERDEPRGDALQPWNRIDDAGKHRWPKWLIPRLECNADDLVLNDNLHGLRHPHRKLAPSAHRVEFIFCRAAAGEFCGQKIGGCHRILDREVDADA